MKFQRASPGALIAVQGFSFQRTTVPCCFVSQAAFGPWPSSFGFHGARTLDLSAAEERPSVPPASRGQVRRPGRATDSRHARRGGTIARPAPPLPACTDFDTHPPAAGAGVGYRRPGVVFCALFSSRTAAGDQRCFRAISGAPPPPPPPHAQLWRPLWLSALQTPPTILFRSGAF